VIEKNSAAKLSLPSDREILVVRDFEAPRALLFDMWSKPEHVRRWYGCAAFTLPICEIDFRVGGSWRWVMHNPADETDHAMSGEYREIVRSERISFTERYEPIAGSDHVCTLGFEERDGVTTQTQHFVYPSTQVRDGHLQAGMEGGMEETFARIDALLASFAPSHSHTDLSI